MPLRPSRPSRTPYLWIHPAHRARERVGGVRHRARISRRDVRQPRIAFRATTPRGVINVIRRRTSRHGAAITRQAVQGTRTASFDASLATGTTSAAREGCDRRERAISNRGNGIRASGAHRLTTHARAFATNRRQIRNVGYQGRIRYRMEVRLRAD